MKLHLHVGTLHQILASIAAALAGFNSGMWRVWPSLAIPHLQSESSEFPVTKTDLSLIASLSYFSYFLSPIICRYIIKFGRKFCIASSLLLFILTWACALLARSPYVLYLGSVAAGFGNGFSSIVVPIYIAEIASSNIRGTLTSGYVLTFTLGQIFTAGVGIHVDFYYLNLAGLIFSIISFGLAVLFVRETPHHFLIVGENEKAKRTYEHFRNNTEASSTLTNEKIDIELEEMKQKILSEMESSSNFKELFNGTGSRRAVQIICCVSAFQMLSGTTSIIAFSSTTLPASHSFLTPDLTVLICLILGTMSNSLGSYLIDVVGRKALLGVSSSLGAVFTAALAVFYFMRDKTDFDLNPFVLVPYILTMSYIATYYLGMGIVRPVFIGELFPSNVKVHASMLSILFLSAASFFVNFIYLHVSSFVGVYAMFLLFTLSNLCNFLSSIFIVIETKGKSLFEIQEHLKTL